jgi:2-succinyl-5-enolpyruvyl-6-hydroxy-3-cyclohexene-1-carboxylate synthase
MTQGDLIHHTLRALATLGVREICIAAGARNAPVVAALAASQNLTLWHFFEERSAAFFALGRILESQRPVAVLTTSGTASAELLPAVIEAYYQAQPLIAFTTDRPKSYRGSGAPQAIEQQHLFGPYVSACLDLDLASPLPLALPPRLNSPLHLNLCLDEPLATDIPGIDFATFTPPPSPPPAPTPAPLDLTAFSQAQRPAVLVAGLSPADAAAIKPLLLALRAPVIAEATSNLWSPPLYDLALASLLLPASDTTLSRLKPDHLLRIGSVPTSRFWRDLEDRPDLPVINLSRAPLPGLARKENVTTHPWSAVASQPSPPPCLAHLPAAPTSPPFTDFPTSEPALIHTLAQQFLPSSQVFLGNSLPIREFNLTAEPLAPDVHFHANRGANGIDGLISTWLGMAATHGADSWLILGDLSALYDLAGPWIIPQLSSRRRFLVVINNGGGKIFSRVASLRGLPESARSMIENRHHLSFRSVAELWGLSHHLITRPEQLPALLSLPADQTHLIELCPDETATEAFWTATAGV